jgi:hypothetical protein
MPEPFRAASGGTKGKRAESAGGVGLLLCAGLGKRTRSAARETGSARPRSFGLVRHSNAGLAGLPSAPLSPLRTSALGRFRSESERGLCLFNRVRNISGSALSRSGLRRERREGETRVGGGTANVAAAAAQVRARSPVAPLPVSAAPGASRGGVRSRISALRWRAKREGGRTMARIGKRTAKMFGTATLVALAATAVVAVAAGRAGADPLCGFSQVSAGWLHTCGIRSDGTVECWGYNTYGQSSPPSGAFAQVSAGGTAPAGFAATARCSAGVRTGMPNPRFHRVRSRK